MPDFAKGRNLECLSHVSLCRVHQAVPVNAPRGAKAPQTSAPRLRKSATISSIFLLDTTSPRPHNPPGFFQAGHMSVPGPQEAPCSISPAGRYSASIRIARHAAIGCAPMPCPMTIAAIAERRCTTFRPRWLRDSGSGRAHCAGHGCFGRSAKRELARQSRKLIFLGTLQEN